jgi:hypothetical protein
MLRIQKKYVFNYKKSPKSNETIPGHTMTMSSYPGILQSGDDFYTISSGLVTQETTIGNSNPDLWSFVKPTGQVLEFIRTMVANRLAQSGKEWSDIFSRYNSGTYNNQWMIVDYNKFKPSTLRGTVFKDGLFWVLEQIPGSITKADM